MAVALGGSVIGTLDGVPPPGNAVPALASGAGRPNSTPLAICLGGCFAAAPALRLAAVLDLLGGGGGVPLPLPSTLTDQCSAILNKQLETQRHVTMEKCTGG